MASLSYAPGSLPTTFLGDLIGEIPPGALLFNDEKLGELYLRYSAYLRFYESLRDYAFPDEITPMDFPKQVRDLMRHINDRKPRESLIGLRNDTVDIPERVAEGLIDFTLRLLTMIRFGELPGEWRAQEKVHGGHKVWTGDESLHKFISQHPPFNRKGTRGRGRVRIQKDLDVCHLERATGIKKSGSRTT